MYFVSVLVCYFEQICESPVLEETESQKPDRTDIYTKSDIHQLQETSS